MSSSGRPSSRGYLAAFALLVACSDSGPAPAGPVEVTPIDQATVGEVSVRVIYRGDVPAPKPLVMGSAPQCALAHEGPVFDQSLLVAEGRVQNAIVWIEKGLENFKFAPPTQPVLIDQVGCLYEPRVAVAMVGQPVEFLNSDAEAHNVHGFPNVLSAWNFILSRKGAKRAMTFDRAEVAVRVGCDIHPWMRGYLGVTSHPYAAVTGKDGAAKLRGLPPGQYTLSVWHESLGNRSAELTMTPKGNIEIEVDLTS